MGEYILVVNALGSIKELPKVILIVHGHPEESYS